MVRIGAKLDDIGFLEFIDDALDRLPCQTHDVRYARNRRRLSLQGNRPDDLPSRAGQTDLGDKRVT
jgi:hypothetical protein